MVHLRRTSDVVIVSAKSAFEENLNSTKAAPMAIVAGAGQLQEFPALSESNNVLVLAPQNTKTPVTLSDSATARLVMVPNEASGRISPQELAGAIASLQFISPIAEFGPDWLRQIDSAEILDELCLTVTKLPQQKFGADTPHLALKSLLPESTLQFTAAHEFANNLFTRWARK